MDQSRKILGIRLATRQVITEAKQVGKRIYLSIVWGIIMITTHPQFIHILRALKNQIPQMSKLFSQKVTLVL